VDVTELARKLKAAATRGELSNGCEIGPKEWIGSNDLLGKISGGDIADNTSMS
jgi:hypothetical protein